MPCDVETLADDLEYERRRSSSVVRSGARPMLRLRHDGAGAHVDLVLLDGARSVEVSFHPAAAAALVAGQARRCGRDPNGWLGALAGAVARDMERWGTWSPAPTSPCRGHLVALLGGLTHPVLGLAYERGAAPVGEVPRWASSSLAESTVAGAATSLFSTRRATRPVVRALASFLARPRIGWWQLALLVGARSALEPDEVAALLLVEPAEDDADASAPLPGTDDLLAIRAAVASGAGRWPRRVLAGALPAAGGARRAARVLRLLLDVDRDIGHPLPAHLDDLEAVCLRSAAIDPAPRRTTSAVPADPEGTAAVARAVVRPAPATSTAGPLDWTRPRGAPATRVRPPPPDPGFRHPASVSELHGVGVGDVVLVLPRTPEELRTWGRLLANCLGDFGPAVAAGCSVIIGVRHGGVLVAALELRGHDRQLVQFVGANNRAAPVAVTRPVLRELARRGLVTAPSPSR